MMRVLCHADAYGISILEVERPNAEQMKVYTNEAQAYIYHGTGEESIALDFITWRDIPEMCGNNKSIGFLPGCNNQIYKITSEQEAELVRVNAFRAKAKQEKERVDRIEDLREIIAQGDAIKLRTGKPLPTVVEARKWQKEWNDINNEGGDGYVPSVLTLEAYNSALKELNRLQRGE